jgi:chemotaxis protein histidine kinase CheA
MQAQSLTTTTATDAISLSHSFDSLSMDAEFINFLLDGGSVEQQPPAALKDTITQDPHPAQPAAMAAPDQFAFSDCVSEQNINASASRTSPTPIATGMPLPPSPPSDGLALSSPSLDDPFAGLTDIFPLLGDLVEPALREEEEIDSGNLPNTTSTTTSSPATASLVKVKEEPKEPKRKSTKEKKASRAAKKQKLEPQPSDFIESLRGLNSAQLEHYAETQPLSEAQQTELKEWIRKIKNRESASLSRQNRKNHQQELEIQIEGLDSSNSRLREQITELQIENRVLKKELDEFKTLLEKSNLGQAFALYNNTKKAATSPAPTSADTPTTAETVVKPVATSAPVATATATATATPTPAAPPATGGIQLSDVILKAMAGGQPNKEGMALVLYLLMALHSYGQYWNKVTAQHQLALSQPQPQPDEVTVQA